MAGYYTTRRKRRAQGATYGGGDPTESTYPLLKAGLGQPPGVSASLMHTSRLLQTTTSFRSGRGESGLVLDPHSLLLTNKESNLKPDSYDNGHTFETRDERRYVSHPRITARGRSGGFYQGVLLPDYNGGQNFWPFLYNSTDFSIVNFSADDITYGTKAMSTVAPGKSPASLLQFLLELKQDFPRLPLKEFSIRNLQSWRRTAGAAADEWLNLEFGINPSLQDIYKIAKTVIHCGKLIDQYYRDVGKMVRRSFHFDPIVTTFEDRTGLVRANRSLVIEESPSQPTWINSMLLDPNEMVSTSRKGTITDEYSFSGAFTYYLDPLLGKLGSEGHFVQQAQYLLGLNLDLDLLYQLTPWSWMADWYVNLGDCISLTSRIAKQSLALRYGYLMRKTTSKLTTTLDKVSFYDGTVFRDVKDDCVVQRKVRLRSTPYGFGLNTASFTGVQWAILAALGMTSGEHQLRYL